MLQWWESCSRGLVNWAQTFSTRSLREFIILLIFRYGITQPRITGKLWQLVWESSQRRLCDVHNVCNVLMHTVCNMFNVFNAHCVLACWRSWGLCVWLRKVAHSCREVAIKVQLDPEATRSQNQTRTRQVKAIFDWLSVWYSPWYHCASIANENLLGWNQRHKALPTSQVPLSHRHENYCHLEPWWWQTFWLHLN